MFVLVIVYNPSDYKWRGPFEISVKGFKERSGCIEYMFHFINKEIEENGNGYHIPVEYTDSTRVSEEEYIKNGYNGKYSKSSQYMHCKIDNKFIHDEEAVSACWNKYFEDEYVDLSYSYVIEEI